MNGKTEIKDRQHRDLFSPLPEEKRQVKMSNVKIPKVHFHEKKLIQNFHISWILQSERNMQNNSNYIQIECNQNVIRDFIPIKKFGIEGSLF